MRRFIIIVLAAAFFKGNAALAAPPPAATVAEKLTQGALQAADLQSVADARSGRYMAASFGLLDHLELSRAAQIQDPDVFDQWAQVMSCMTNRPTYNPVKAPDFQVAQSQLADLREATAIPAIAEIVRRARKTRIVILDENHLEPRDRAFALDVARALRPLGYTVLALEALKGAANDSDAKAKMAKLMIDGHAAPSTGYYFDDPVFADFLRQSLSLGYRPVAYETTRTSYSSDPKVAQSQREQDQAKTLMRRAVLAYPDAKILVYVGEHHAAERPIAAEGGNVRMMAELLKEFSRIDPLTIDQAGLSAIPMNRPNVDLFAIASQKARTQSMALMLHGQPLTVGLLAGSVDIQVVHPTAVIEHGRPTWLVGLGRKPQLAPPTLMPTSGTRLIQAFLTTDGSDAIPVDQVLVYPGERPPMLMLPEGTIRYAVQDGPGLARKSQIPMAQP